MNHCFQSAGNVGDVIKTHQIFNMFSAELRKMLLLYHRVMNLVYSSMFRQKLDANLLTNLFACFLSYNIDVYKQET